MNIFKKFWIWLKNVLTKEYKKEQFLKSDIIKYLEKKIPKKQFISIKDIVDVLKELCK